MKNLIWTLHSNSLRDWSQNSYSQFNNANALTSWISCFR